MTMPAGPPHAKYQDGNGREPLAYHQAAMNAVHAHLSEMDYVQLVATPEARHRLYVHLTSTAQVARSAAATARSRAVTAPAPEADDLWSKAENRDAFAGYVEAFLTRLRPQVRQDTLGDLLAAVDTHRATRPGVADQSDMALYAVADLIRAEQDETIPTEDA